MLSNSKSARRSRIRKQKQIEDLIEEACRLKNENGHLKQNIKATEDAYAEMEETNNVVRVQPMEFSNRLLFPNSMVEDDEMLMIDLMIWLCFMILFSSLYSYLIRIILSLL
ncbi:hypothetical protein RYX36_028968 [Vicia faba]